MGEQAIRVCIDLRYILISGNKKKEEEIEKEIYPLL